MAWDPDDVGSLFPLLSGLGTSILGLAPSPTVNPSKNSRLFCMLNLADNHKEAGEKKDYCWITSVGLLQDYLSTLGVHRGNPGDTLGYPGGYESRTPVELLK